ncbi:acid protease [Trametes versicolor FP-101664 SS1]|uniref:acid protease n=1 Tax=Trametes versicolor (strain FP-101664) TaxID=717944 RepID=UPI0004622120|nr:acid protease [Trametes versicolor FP-101664 SS1]EIW59384.1 acid protease [Trametes versicolor FP-101664 SS1]
MKATSLALSLALCSSELASALRLSLHGQPRPKRVGGGLGARATVAGNTSVGNIGDVQYTTDITLGGSKFSVQIDTGSSDLWVAGTVPNSKDTGKAAKVQYAVDGVQGSVDTADLDFAGYTITDQAYINAPITPTHTAGSGLIGLGPNTGSEVKAAIGASNSAGDPVLDRIFRQNTSTPNYITFLLGRIRDPTDPPNGDLTVGELIPGYESVTSQPKLSVSTVAKSNSGNQHWQILLDADGIIGPAGNNVIDQYNVETAVDSTSNDKQLTVVVDTGYSLPQVPPRVAEAFYANVPGAQLVNVASLDGQIWQLPCDKEVNVTFKFAGVSYPMHPLDTNIDLNMTDGKGNPICFGAFQPLQAPDGATYDMIFGMAFLRNVYTYINFGDFVDGATDTTADPYVQLLSTTNDTAEWHADFIKVRGNSPWTPTGATFAERIRARLPLIIGLSVAAGVVLLLAIGACCYYRRRNQRQRMAFFRPGQMYQPLHEPAPPEAHDLHLVGSAGGGPPPYAQQQQGFQQGYNPSYSNPWDARY